MTVTELINNLALFAQQHPLNAHAEIMLKTSDCCFEIGHADHAKRLPGENYLVFVPNELGKRFAIKEMKVM